MELICKDHESVTTDVDKIYNDLEVDTLEERHPHGYFFTPDLSRHLTYYLGTNCGFYWAAQCENCSKSCKCLSMLNSSQAHSFPTHDDIKRILDLGFIYLLKTRPDNVVQYGTKENPLIRERLIQKINMEPRFPDHQILKKYLTPREIKRGIKTKRTITIQDVFEVETHTVVEGIDYDKNRTIGWWREKGTKIEFWLLDGKKQDEFWYYGDGTKNEERWFDEKGELHRENGPAHIRYYKNKKKHSETWYKHGLEHRQNDLPAGIIWNLKGKKVAETWQINGEEHRDDNPSYILYHVRSGLKVKETWCKHGLEHRETGPAIITYTSKGKNNHYEWWKNGKREREQYSQSVDSLSPLKKVMPNQGVEEQIYLLVEDLEKEGVLLGQYGNYAGHGSVVSTDEFYELKSQRKLFDIPNVLCAMEEIPNVFCWNYKTWRKARGSYGLKHVLEGWRDGDYYISNGDFIMAAMLLQHEVKFSDKFSDETWVNPLIKLSAK